MARHASSRVSQVIAIRGMPLTFLWAARETEIITCSMPPPSSLPASLKKRKFQDESSSQHAITNNIQKLEADLISAVSTKASLNPLADLLETAQSSSKPQTLTKAVYALYRVFVVVITRGLLLSTSGDENSKVVRDWLQERLRSYVDLLVGLLKDEEVALRVCFSQKKGG